MMLRPLRLHEIARKADAKMVEVFDVVNAYDAIGLLEWQPRQSRYAAEAESPARADAGAGNAPAACGRTADALSVSFPTKALHCTSTRAPSASPLAANAMRAGKCSLK